MGCKPIPHYANNFMASIDKLIKNIDNREAIQILKRFLYDYFLIYSGTSKELHALLVKINQINPTIKITINHTKIQHESPEDQVTVKQPSSIPF